MVFNSKDELMDDAGEAFTVTYTTNSPSASNVATVADGDVITSAEVGALFFNMQAQIDALRTAINA